MTPSYTCNRTTRYTVSLVFGPYSTATYDSYEGFTISLLEWEATIPSLWSTVKEFIALYPQHIDPQNAMDFLSNDGGATYNRCHCKQFLLSPTQHHIAYDKTVWSNFEIADLDFWRSRRYQDFFNYLENKGGFYYEVRVLCDMVILALL